MLFDVQHYPICFAVSVVFADGFLLYGKCDKRQLLWYEGQYDPRLLYVNNLFRNLRKLRDLCLPEAFEASGGVYRISE